MSDLHPPISRTIVAPLTSAAFAKLKKNSMKNRHIQLNLENNLEEQLHLKNEPNAK